MLTSSYGAIPSITPKTLFPTGKERETRAQAVSGSRSYENYDSVTLSPASGENRFHKELVSRLSQEVRTATTTGDIQSLRQSVSAGQYVPDPMAIAAKILFLGEEQ